MIGRTSSASARRNRRQLLQSLTASAGGLLIVGGVSASGVRFATAQEDDDSSGRGRGRGRGGDENNSGHGGGDEVDIPLDVEIPAGSLEIRIVSDDAGGFVPGDVTVDLGQSVSFVNAHSDEHTATGSGFDTGIIAEGTVATVVMEEPGSFAYACLIHPEMTGMVRVRDADGVVPQAQAAQTTAPADAIPVSIANFAFAPAEVSVATGATVVWSNDDAAPHTVTSLDGAFDSGIFDPGATFTWTFAEPGTFAYQCQLHPQMQGSVIAAGDAVAVQNQVAEPAAAPQPAQAATAADADTAVSIVDFAFEPGTLEVAAGTTVVWTNNGLAPHTVTGEFADSGAIAPGDPFSHTFAAEGDFPYVCAFHPQMTATVRVGPGSAALSPPDEGTNADAVTAAGTWIVALTPDETQTLAPQSSFVTLHEDGTADASFAAMSESPPSIVLNSGHGQWTTDGDQLDLAFLVLAHDLDGRFAGTLTVQSRTTIAPDDLLAGEFSFDFVADTGEVVAAGTGALSGYRSDLETLLGEGS